jgi:hypothetical protein
VFYVIEIIPWMCYKKHTTISLSLTFKDLLMASFNSTPSAFPRQAVVASATLPPKAPAPSFFGGNTADANPSAPVVDPAPPADTFTATAPAPVATTAPDPADAKKAEAAKKENGFVKFAKSPWGIGAGVAAVLGGGLLIWKKPWQGGNTISQLEKVVKDLGIDDLDPEHKNNLLQKFAEHLQGLTANTTEHTPETWDKLSSAIVDLHDKHGTDEIAQTALLQGLGESSPENLKDLSVEARKALVNTSTAYIDNIENIDFTSEQIAHHLPYIQQAAEQILYPHGEKDFGIRNQEDLVKTSEKLLNIFDKVKQPNVELNSAVMGFASPEKSFPLSPQG